MRQIQKQVLDLQIAQADKLLAGKTTVAILPGETFEQYIKRCAALRAAQLVVV